MTNITKEGEDIELKKVDSKVEETESKQEDPINNQTLTVPVKYVFDMKTEVEYLRYLKSQGRPLSMPGELTANEYNFLVDYLKKQRVMLLNLKGDSTLKKIK